MDGGNCDVMRALVVREETGGTRLPGMIPAIKRVGFALVGTGRAPGTQKPSEKGPIMDTIRASSRQSRCGKL